MNEPETAMFSLDSPDLAALAREVGRILGERAAAVTDEVNRAIEADVADLNAPASLELLHDSVEANISTILYMLANGVPLDRADPGTAARAYAVRLAGDGVPSNSLRRAYHFGADSLLGVVFEVVRTMEMDDDRRWRLLRYLASWISNYVDRVTIDMLDTYSREARRIHSERAAQASSLVQRILDGDPPRGFTERTGYPLTATHLAVVVWVERGDDGPAFGDPRGIVDGLARRLGTSTRLSAGLDRTRIRAWFAWKDPDSVPTPARLVALAADDPGVRVAVGTPHADVDGFRRTHHEAVAASSVLEVGPPQRRSLWYGNTAVPLTAMLIDDLPALTDWVRRTLGGLAVDDERCADLRATLRVLFEEDGNQQAAAARLVLHRNSVRYRARQAATVRGAALEDRRFDLRAALEIADLLGERVLIGSDEVGPGRR